MPLQLQFDSKQEYQVNAVESIVRLFDGLSRIKTEYVLSDESVANLPDRETLDETWLFDNLCAVQQDTAIQNNRPIPQKPTLEVDDGFVLEGAGYESWRAPHFTVEMETGTGKTYVYLRTISELRARYGFGKFIVVVPSIAIYEGVIKNFEVTRDHFRALYGNETINVVRYDGSQLSRLKSFATSTFCEIMVMTLDAFNKASNVIYKPTEKLPGEMLPFQYIQKTRPILILDEPQNMESPKSKEALRTLHPLFVLRYSATHKSSPNLAYRLTPFDAYRYNLVKKIQVLGIREEENYNRPFLALRSVTEPGLPIRATVKTYVTLQGQTSEADIVLKQGDDLFTKTSRDDHRGYTVAEINVAEKWVAFENGIRIDMGATLGAMRRELFKEQIERTIDTHLRTQERLRPKGLKVLSLFFIDRVANYIQDDGIIRTIFDQCFDEMKAEYPAWKDRDAAEVQAGYFAAKKKASGETEIIETRDVDEDKKNADERKAERAAFELIMKAKERLLSFEEPVSFLFAHSALREGWDNPNVFQICTLNQTISETRKRQEIGRGLRLCVDQSGERVFGDEVNCLTVVANESYFSYVSKLQTEYRETQDETPPSPTDAARSPARRRDDIFTHKQFHRLWDTLALPVTTSFNLSVDELVKGCISRLNKYPFTLPKLVIEKGSFVMTQFSLELIGPVAGGGVRLRLTIRTTEDNAKPDLFTTDEDDGDVHTFSAKQGTDLSRALRDERLRGFRVADIDGDSDDITVKFGNGIELTKSSPYVWTSEAGQRPASRETMARRDVYPVGNLIARAAQETGLTRPTINRVFKGMDSDKAIYLLKNPESFIGAFISEVSNELADHIANNIEFTPNEGAKTPHDLESLFPAERQLTQKEMVPSKAKSLYDQVQIDSDNERFFVPILEDDKSLVFYFKFPPAYKIPLPRQIGNYNPDWGIARLDDTGISVLEVRERNDEGSFYKSEPATLLYVRETKGNENIHDLQWPHEKRKIRCAIKYFHALGLDYRPVKGDNASWYERQASSNALNMVT